MKKEISDNLAYRFPVSVKGVVVVDGKIPLLQNERDEFELPGGKLEVNEQPTDCLIREIKEELNLDVSVEQILDSWLYHIDKKTHVLIVTYGCSLKSHNSRIQRSSEHKRLVLVDSSDLRTYIIPSGYIRSIENWLKLLRKK